MKLSKLLSLLFLFPVLLHAQIKVKELPTKTTNFKQGDNIIIDDSTGGSGATKKISVGSLKTNYGFINPTSGFIPYNNLGTFSDSPFYIVGDSIKIADGKRITSANGMSYIRFNSGASLQGIASDGVNNSGNWRVSPSTAVLQHVDAITGSSGITFSGPGFILRNQNSANSKNGKIDSDVNRIKLTHTDSLLFDAPLINMPQGTASKLLYLDASKNLKPATMGQGISFVSGTLTATGDTVSLSNRINTKLTKGGDAGAAIFAGTTTAHDFNLIANNFTRLQIASTGEIGVNASPSTGFTGSSLYVKGASAGPATSFSFKAVDAAGQAFLSVQDNGNVIIGHSSSGATYISSGTTNFSSGYPGIMVLNSAKNVDTLKVGSGLAYNKTTSTLTASGGGSVTTFTVTPANGFTGTVANPTTTPALTIVAGAITPTSVNGVVLSGSSTPTLAVSGTSTISGTHSGTSSGTNTGDQTSVTGNAGTATALQTGRTIGITGDLTYTSPSFNGTANVTATSTVNKILGNTVPANASGALTNNGSGTLSWVPYVAADGSIPLTANWNAGAHSITTNGVTIGGPTIGVDVASTNGINVNSTGYGLNIASSGKGVVIDADGVPLALKPSSDAFSSLSEGDMYNQSVAKALIGFFNGIKQAYNSIIYENHTDKTVANSTTETTLLSTTYTGSPSLAADYFSVGEIMHIKAGGVYSATGTPQLTFSIKIGSTVTNYVVILTAVTSMKWEIDLMYFCTATGTSGNLKPRIWIEVGKTGTTSERTPYPASTTTAINTTVANTIDLTATWNAASASNTVTCQWMTIERKPAIK